MNEIGKVLVILGLVLAAVGALMWAGVGKGWFGRLPGDIHYAARRNRNQKAESEKAKSGNGQNVPAHQCRADLLFWMFRK